MKGQSEVQVAVFETFGIPQIQWVKQECVCGSYRVLQAAFGLGFRDGLRASDTSMPLGRRLIEKAEKRGRARGHTVLELETRIELVENHAAFQKMGFIESGEGAHEGFDQPTWIAMRKSI